MRTARNKREKNCLWEAQKHAHEIVETATGTTTTTKSQESAKNKIELTIYKQCQIIMCDLNWA